MFGIPEMMVAIIEHCSRPTVVSLAQVSKSFNLLAVDTIWALLDSFHPLLETLPKDLFEERYSVRSFDDELRGLVRCSPFSRFLIF